MLLKRYELINYWKYEEYSSNMSYDRHANILIFKDRVSVHANYSRWGNVKDG